MHYKLDKDKTDKVFEMIQSLPYKQAAPIVHLLTEAAAGPFDECEKEDCPEKDAPTEPKE